MNKRRVGVLGGTFDPVHLGHLRLMRSAVKALGLERVYVVPSRKNPLKARESAVPLSDRLAMLRIALKNESRARLCLYETRQKRLSYTVYTLRYLKSRLAAGTEIFFLCGSDVLKNFGQWKRHQEILQLATLAVARRPEAPVPAIKPAFKARFFEMPPVKVSSTAVREMLFQNINCRKELPTGVYRYIMQRKLYSSARLKGQFP
ncbi:MAG: nicotinate (nicotinamide) nucleotide adenylyltransferase [Candidatus Omnitrophica bacterium]|nr:nicotinate (nicotinamide) nucleotide adenylyltransferase [Candidatus Omnitrophota bacterium]